MHIAYYIETVCRNEILFYFTLISLNAENAAGRGLERRIRTESASVGQRTAADDVTAGRSHMAL